MSSHLLQKLQASKEVSLRELIKTGTTFLRKSSIEEPRRNVEMLLSYILKKPVYYIYTEDISIPHKSVIRYNKLLVKRAMGIPLQYLTRTVNFYGYDFFIQEGVFIPRPETEILVEKAIEIYKRYFSPGYIKILDIGTGCGNIAISLAREIKKCRIVATDISEKAIKTANYNAELHRVKNRIEFLKTNTFPLQEKKFHIIVTNPPYIPGSEIVLLEKEVRREPFRALSGGKEGFNLIKKIIRDADRFLQDRGFLLIEIGDKQGRHIRQIQCSLELIAIEKDLSGIERVVIFHKRKV